MTALICGLYTGVPVAMILTAAFWPPPEPPSARAERLAGEAVADPVPAAAIAAAAAACPFVNRDALARALEAAQPHIAWQATVAERELCHAAAWRQAAAAVYAERDRIRQELAGDQTADHAPIESDHGLTCRTCVAWQDDEGMHEFGIAIPEPWPCHVARALDAS